MPESHSDDLFRFSYRIFKFEYVAVKLVFLALSLYGLYRLAKEEIGFDNPPVHEEVTKSRPPSP